MLTAIFPIFIFLVVAGFVNQKKIQDDTYNDCAETDLYAIGNKGHKIRIYDCSRGEDEKT